MFDITVVIPTHNRARLLGRTLELLNEQTYPRDRYSVIIVDDGSTDDTGDIVKAARDKAVYQLKYIRQEHKGPAAARNMGIREAESDFILFTGDDIFPDSNLISQHMILLSSHPDCAVLGYVGWSAEETITDFMDFVAPNGFQFRYNTIKNPDDCDFKHFYTSNISIGKRWLIEDKFDEDFPYGALEDTELSYRLKKKGLRIIFNNKAVGYHCHNMTIDSFSMRMRLTGISSVILAKKHPELKSTLQPIDARLASPVFSLLGRIGLIEKLNKRLYWFIRITDSYLKGIMEWCKKV